jgi:hypothetical protein
LQRTEAVQDGGLGLIQFGQGQGLNPRPFPGACALRHGDGLLLANLHFRSTCARRISHHLPVPLSTAIAKTSLHMVPWRLGFGAEALRLRCFPVQGVDFLAADVADEKRRIVRRQAHPRQRQTRGFGAPKAFEVPNSFQLAIADSHAKDRGILGRVRIEIDILAVARPGRRIYRSPGQFRPFPRGAVEQHDGMRISRQRRDVPAVRRAARMRQSLGPRQNGNLASRQIQNLNPRVLGAFQRRIMSKDERFTIRRPAQIIGSLSGG